MFVNLIINLPSLTQIVLQIDPSDRYYKTTIKTGFPFVFNETLYVTAAVFAVLVCHKNRHGQLIFLTPYEELQMEVETSSASPQSVSAKHLSVSVCLAAIRHQHELSKLHKSMSHNEWCYIN